MAAIIPEQRSHSVLPYLLVVKCVLPFELGVSSLSAVAAS